MMTLEELSLTSLNDKVQIVYTLDAESWRQIIQNWTKLDPIWIGQLPSVYDNTRITWRIVQRQKLSRDSKTVWKRHRTLSFREHWHDGYQLLPWQSARLSLAWFWCWYPNSNKVLEVLDVLKDFSLDAWSAFWSLIRNTFSISISMSDWYVINDTIPLRNVS